MRHDFPGEIGRRFPQPGERTAVDGSVYAVVDDARSSGQPSGMRNVWGLIEAYLDDSGAKEAAVARKAQLSPQTLNSWKHGRLKGMPSNASLYQLAQAIKTPYSTVLDAALLDWGYRPEEVARDAAANRLAPVINLDGRRLDPGSKKPRVARGGDLDEPQGD